MYITDAYARIQCTKCGNKIVDILKPGQVFESIKQCPCQEVKEEPKKVVKKKAE